jgi:hypothetical protein
MSSILKVDEIQNTDGKTGLVITPDGSIDGIKFPEEANPSGRTITSTTMSSYEEGTYTVVITANTGSITLSSLAQDLSYVKIGNLVHIHGRLDVESVSSPTTRLEFTLPFKSAANVSGESNYTAGVVYINYSKSLTPGDFALLINQNATTGRLYKSDSESLSSGGANAQQLQAGSIIYLSVQYLAV